MKTTEHKKKDPVGRRMVSIKYFESRASVFILSGCEHKKVRET